MRLQIRKARLDDIPGMVELFYESLGVHKSVNNFIWWNKLPSITYCAMDKGKLVGMFMVIRRKLYPDLNCGVLMGLVVNNRWKGKGLFKELGEKALNHYGDIDVFCCLTNQVGKKALARNFNFKTIETIETLSINPKNSAPFKNCVGKKIVSAAEFNSFNKKNNKVIMFLTNENFRKWRYLDHPHYSYELIRLDSNEYAIINRFPITENKVKYGDLVDFETKKLDENNLTKLFECVLNVLGKDRDLITLQAVPESYLYKISKIFGFEESETRHYLSIKVRDTSNEYLYEPSRWLIKWGDFLR